MHPRGTAYHLPYSRTHLEPRSRQHVDTDVEGLAAKAVHGAPQQHDVETAGTDADSDDDNAYGDGHADRNDASPDAKACVECPREEG